MLRFESKFFLVERLFKETDVFAVWIKTGSHGTAHSPPHEELNRDLLNSFCALCIVAVKVQAYVIVAKGTLLRPSHLELSPALVLVEEHQVRGDLRF